MQRAYVMIVAMGVDPDETCDAVMDTVIYAMVQRSMASTADDAMAGVRQRTQTAGSYSENFTFANPSGDLYLTAMEKQALGISKKYAAGMHKVAVHDRGGEQIDW